MKRIPEAIQEITVGVGSTSLTIHAEPERPRAEIVAPQQHFAPDRFPQASNDRFLRIAFASSYKLVNFKQWHFTSFSRSLPSPLNLTITYSITYIKSGSSHIFNG